MYASCSEIKNIYIYLSGGWLERKGINDLCASKLTNLEFLGGPNGTRTRVFGVRGRCPRPLDDGTVTPNIKFKVPKTLYTL
jgi:hypothetical protein